MCDANDYEMYCELTMRLYNLPQQILGSIILAITRITQNKLKGVK